MISPRLQDQTVEELRRLLLERQHRLRELRFKQSANQVKDVREIRKTRKDIARILTAQRAQPV
jgi:large subunit ribosomal protein L29